MRCLAGRGAAWPESCGAPAPGAARGRGAVGTGAELRETVLPNAEAEPGGWEEKGRGDWQVEHTPHSIAAWVRGTVALFFLPLSMIFPTVSAWGRAGRCPGARSCASPRRAARHCPSPLGAARDRFAVHPSHARSMSRCASLSNRGGRGGGANGNSDSRTIRRAPDSAET